MKKLTFAPVCVTCEAKAEVSAGTYTEIYDGDLGARTKCAPLWLRRDEIAFSGKSLPGTSRSAGDCKLLSLNYCEKGCSYAIRKICALPKLLLTFSS